MLFLGVMFCIMQVRPVIGEWGIPENTRTAQLLGIRRSDRSAACGVAVSKWCTRKIYEGQQYDYGWM